MRFRRLFLHSIFIVFVLVMFNLRLQQVAAQTDVPSPQPLTLVGQTKVDGDAVLISPGDVAVDGLGNSYVSTLGNNSIKKFDSQGNFVTQWGMSGKDPGNFMLCLGVAIDADNNIYVTDWG